MSAERRDQLPDAPTRPSHRSRRGRWRAKLGDLEWHLDKLVQVEEAIEKLLGASKMNAAGVAALFSRALDVRKGIERIQASRPWMAGATIEELREWLELSLDEWPDEFLELGIRVYAARHKGRILFIHEGGTRAELDPEEGWVQLKDG